jgi:hypothetical protein
MELNPLERHVAAVTSPLSSRWLKLLADPAWCRGHSWSDLLAAMPAKGNTLVRQLCVALDRLSAAAADSRAENNPAWPELGRFSEKLGILLMTAVTTSKPSCGPVLLNYHRPVLETEPQLRNSMIRAINSEADRRRAASLYDGDVIETFQLLSIFHTFHPTGNGGALRSPNPIQVATEECEKALNGLAADGTCGTAAAAAQWLWERLAYRAHTEFEAALGFVRKVAAYGASIDVIEPWPLPAHQPYSYTVWESAVQAHRSESAMRATLKAAADDAVTPTTPPRRRKVQI